LGPQSANPTTFLQKQPSTKNWGSSKNHRSPKGNRKRRSKRSLLSDSSSDDSDDVSKKDVRLIKVVSTAIAAQTHIAKDTLEKTTSSGKVDKLFKAIRKGKLPSLKWLPAFLKQINCGDAVDSSLELAIKTALEGKPLNRNSHWALTNWLAPGLFLLMDKLLGDCQVQLEKLLDAETREPAFLRLFARPSKSKSILDPVGDNSSEGRSKKEKKSIKVYEKALQGLQHSDIMKIKVNQKLIGWTVNAAACVGRFATELQMDAATTFSNIDIGYRVRAFENNLTTMEGVDKIFFGANKNVGSLESVAVSFRDKLTRERNKVLMKTLGKFSLRVEIRLTRFFLPLRPTELVRRGILVC